MAEALGTDEPGARAGGSSATGNGLSPLTVREWEVASLIADGLTNRQIAAGLSISPRTIDRHVEHILAKLGVTARAQIAAWVARA
jgi:DNA-binding NarL/FixJ family response regulator